MILSLGMSQHANYTAIVQIRRPEFRPLPERAPLFQGRKLVCWISTCCLLISRKWYKETTEVHFRVWHLLNWKQELGPEQLGALQNLSLQAVRTCNPTCKPAQKKNKKTKASHKIPGEAEIQAKGIEESGVKKKTNKSKWKRCRASVFLLLPPRVTWRGNRENRFQPCWASQFTSGADGC